ncbi:MAG: hypothetical protein PWP08_1806 [Methanofollis sp.]|nr:hypothetical protein [Methanofollis sp.]
MRGVQALLIAVFFLTGIAGPAMAAPAFEIAWEKTAGDTVNDVAISADGSTIAVLTGSTLECYAADGGLRWEVPGGHARHVGMSEDGSAVVIDGEDIRAYNGTGAQVFRHANGYFAFGVGISPDGSCIAGGFDNESLMLFRKNATGVFLPAWSVGIDDDIIALDLAENASSITAGDRDGMLLRYADGGRLLWRYDTGSSRLSCSITSDGSYIVVGADHGAASCINSNGKRLWTAISGDGLPGIGIAEDKPLIAVGGESVTLRSPGGEVLDTVSDKPAHALAISGDGRTVVTADNGKTVTLYRACEEAPVTGSTTLPGTPARTTTVPEETAPTETEAASSPPGAFSAIVSVFAAMYCIRRH